VAGVAAPVDVVVAPAASAAGRRFPARALLEGSQALERGGRLDQRAVHAEVLAAEQLVRFGLGADGAEEGLGDLGVQQPVPSPDERAGEYLRSLLGPCRRFSSLRNENQRSVA
jgi:hypothetical protein